MRYDVREKHHSRKPEGIPPEHLPEGRMRFFELGCPDHDSHDADETNAFKDDLRC